MIQDFQIRLKKNTLILMCVKVACILIIMIFSVYIFLNFTFSTEKIKTNQLVNM